MNEKKKKIIDVSLQLFTEKGFRTTSIQDIIEHANISKGTFYNYFSSKNECFLAILEQLRYTAQLRRYELLLGKNEQDLSVLIEQIIIPMKINEENNLITLFEGVFQSSDAELKKGLHHHHFQEIKWLTERFTDVFGEEIRPYAFECVILFFGMVQYSAVTWRSTYRMAVDIRKLVEERLRYIQALFPIMQQSGDVLLKADMLQILENNIVRPTVTKDNVYEQLQQFAAQFGQESIVTGRELTIFLLEELAQDNWRKHVIAALLPSYHKAFKNTLYEVEAIELSYKISYLLKQEE